MSADGPSILNVAPASEEIEQLRIVCSYCKKVLREGTPGARTSHGICTSEACRAKFKGTEGLVEISESGEVEHLA